MEEIDQLNVSTLLNEANIGVVVHRWDTTIIYANPTALRLLRLTEKQIKGKDAFDPYWRFIDKRNNPLAVEEFPVHKLKKNKKNLTNEIIGIVDSQSTRPTWVSVNAYIEATSDLEDDTKLVITFTDVTESRSGFSCEDILEKIQDMVVVTEADQLDAPNGPKIVYVNQSFVDISGYQREQIIGKTPRILQGPGTNGKAKQRIKKALKNKEPISESILNYDANQKEYWLELNIVPLTNSFGEVTHFAAIERDITEKRYYLDQLEQNFKATYELSEALEEKAAELEAAKKKLESIAYLDPLTQAPNRRYFFTHAKKIQKSSQRNSKSVAFGLIDIENFKTFNDEYGHDVGDQVLVAISHCLKELFREDDLYCRYGGEEFAFAVSLSSMQDCQQFATRLISNIRAAKITTDKGNQLNITASIGLAFSSCTSDINIEDILKSADSAMYRAKNAGKDQFVITLDA